MDYILIAIIFGFLIGFLLYDLNEKYQDYKLAKTDFNEKIAEVLQIKESIDGKKISYIDVSEFSAAECRALLKTFKK